MGWLSSLMVGGLLSQLIKTTRRLRGSPTRTMPKSLFSLA